MVVVTKEDLDTACKILQRARDTDENQTGEVIANWALGALSRLPKEIKNSNKGSKDNNCSSNSASDVDSDIDVDVDRDNVNGHAEKNSSIGSNVSHDIIVTRLWNALADFYKSRERWVMTLFSSHPSLANIIVIALQVVPRTDITLCESMLTILPDLYFSHLFDDIESGNNGGKENVSFPLSIDHALLVRSAAIKLLPLANKDARVKKLVKCIFSKTARLFHEPSSNSTKKIVNHVLSNDFDTMLDLLNESEDNYIDDLHDINFLLEDDFDDVKLETPLTITVFQHLSLACFSFSNLKRTLSQSGNPTGSNDLIKILKETAYSRGNSKVVNIIPFLFQKYASSLHKNGTQLFPLTSRNHQEVPQSAQETHTLNKMRIMSLQFLNELLDMLTTPVCPRQIYVILQTIKKYTLFHPRVVLIVDLDPLLKWDRLLMQILDSLISPTYPSTNHTLREYSLKTLSLLLNIGLDPLLPGIERLLSIIKTHPVAESHNYYDDILQTIVTYYSKTASLDSFMTCFRNALLTTKYASAEQLSPRLDSQKMSKSKNSSSTRWDVAVAHSPLFQPTFIAFLTKSIYAIHVNSFLSKALLECADTYVQEINDYQQLKDESKNDIFESKNTDAASRLVVVANWIVVYIRSLNFKDEFSRRDGINKMKEFLSTTDRQLEISLEDNKNISWSVLLSSFRIRSALVEAVKDLITEDDGDDKTFAVPELHPKLREQSLSFVNKKFKKTPFETEARYEIIRSTLLENKLPEAGISTIVYSISSSSQAEGPRWNGVLAELTPSLLPEAVWNLLTRYYMPTIDRYCKSNEELDVISSIFWVEKSNTSSTEEISGFDRATYDLLSWAPFFELKSLRARLLQYLRYSLKDGVLSVSEDDEDYEGGDAMEVDTDTRDQKRRILLTKISHFPSTYFPLELRRQLVTAAYYFNQFSFMKSSRYLFRTLMQRFIMLDEIPHPKINNVEALIKLAKFPDVESSSPELLESSVKLYESALTIFLKSAITNKEQSNISALLKKLVKRVSQISICDRIEEFSVNHGEEFQLLRAEYSLLITLKVVNVLNYQSFIFEDLNTWDKIQRWVIDSVATAMKVLDKVPLISDETMIAQQQGPFLFNNILEILVTYILISKSREAGEELAIKSNQFLNLLLSKAIAVVINFRGNDGEKNNDESEKLRVITSRHKRLAVLLCQAYSVLGRAFCPLPALVSGFLMLETLNLENGRLMSLLEFSPCMQRTNNSESAQKLLKEFADTCDLLMNSMITGFKNNGEEMARSNMDPLAFLNIDPLGFLGFLLCSFGSNDAIDGLMTIVRDKISLSLRYLLMAIKKTKSYTPLKPKAVLSISEFLLNICSEKIFTLQRQDIVCIWSILGAIHENDLYSDDEFMKGEAEIGSEIMRSMMSIVGNLCRHRREHVIPTFGLMMTVLNRIIRNFTRNSVQVSNSKELDGDRMMRTMPDWVWRCGGDGSISLGVDDADEMNRLLSGLTTRVVIPTSQNQSRKTQQAAAASLVGPLSKHAPIFIVDYMYACCADQPIASDVRARLLPGMCDIIQTIGKHERATMMDGFLDSDRERALLRLMFAEADRRQYKGE